MALLASSPLLGLGKYRLWSAGFNFADPAETSPASGGRRRERRIAFRWLPKIAWRLTGRVGSLR